MPASSTQPLSPAQRTAKVEARILEYVDKYDRMRDERAVFAFLYYKVTQNLTQILTGNQAGFEDPAWVASLSEVFAARFLGAMDSIDKWLQSTASGDPPEKSLYDAAPRPWADTYLAIRRHRAYVLESLLFSMLPHLTYDLPQALRELDPQAQGHCHVRDFDEMNRTLADETTAIEKAIAHRYNPLLPYVDKLVVRYGSLFSREGIRVTRSVAWYDAVRLSDPDAAAAAMESISGDTGKFIDFVRRPKEWWLRVPLRIARFLLPRYHRWPKQPSASAPDPAAPPRSLPQRPPA